VNLPLLAYGFFFPENSAYVDLNFSDLKKKHVVDCKVIGRLLQIYSPYGSEMTEHFLTCEIYRCCQGCHDDCSSCSLVTELFQDATKEWHKGQLMSRSRNLETDIKTLYHHKRHSLITLLHTRMQ
jgi:ssDNA-binding Zn-finger/Zn-ribbon topoisomerase 1